MPTANSHICMERVDTNIFAVRPNNSITGEANIGAIAKPNHPIHLGSPSFFRTRIETATSHPTVKRETQYFSNGATP